jgi:hypothetical protein
MRHGARLDQLVELYNQPGPFATAYVEVSRDAESGNQVAELAAREAADALLALGAPEEVAAAIREVEPEHPPAGSDQSLRGGLGERGVARPALPQPSPPAIDRLGAVA